jgi:hypothetical protein
MQLNKTHKAEIVNKIMADIPQADYGQIINRMVQDKAYDLMPAEVKAVYDNEDARKFLALRNCVAYGDYAGGIGNIHWVSVGTYGSLYLNRQHYNDSDGPLTAKLLSDIREPLEHILRLAETQHKDRRSMRDKLIAMLQGIRTLKQAKDMLEVELHKYLPAPPPKDDAQKAAQASTALVPYVVANLREMGWPKDQEPSTKEGAN